MQNPGFLAGNVKKAEPAGVLKGFPSVILAHVRMAVFPGETPLFDIPKTGVGNHYETRLKWSPIPVNPGFPKTTGNRLRLRSAAKVAAMPLAMPAWVRLVWPHHHVQNVALAPRFCPGNRHDTL